MPAAVCPKVFAWSKIQFLFIPVKKFANNKKPSRNKLLTVAKIRNVRKMIKHNIKNNIRWKKIKLNEEKLKIK